MRLKEKTALVTGAGSGIGKAIAERLTEEGAHVLCCDLNEMAAEHVAASIRAKGLLASSWPVDVSQPEQVGALFERLDNANGLCGRWWVYRALSKV
ncbi:MAG: SDR family NAD(P)-dependent oxidoreductase [Alicyclobacillus macrosporangiidus]|uniref:SDR family NAD(P)-dependent oxidoreductase n=1 Tax=Alicyclobacillus macrosporangiidus TaxID=392015 RepID=UPI0034E94906|nr:SDR family NAD(P)-dependent oxidoreductase [Alicyclobacillus macrosporangiidus]